MTYDGILQSIDFQLERLQAARKLLTETTSPAPRGEQKKRQVKAQGSSIGETSVVLRVEENRATTRTQQARPEADQEMKAPVPAPSERKALAGAIPTGPVVVAPRDVALLLRTPASNGTSESSQQAASVAGGTLEALVRDLQARRTSEVTLQG